MSGGIVEKIRESIRRSNFLIEQSRALVLATAGLVSESSDTRTRRLHRVGLTQFQLNWNNDLVSSPPDPGLTAKEQRELLLLPLSQLLPRLYQHWIARAGGSVRELMIAHSQYAC
jgi:hypothetical protein